MPASLRLLWGQGRSCLACRRCCCIVFHFVLTSRDQRLMSQSSTRQQHVPRTFAMEMSQSMAVAQEQALVTTLLLLLTLLLPPPAVSSSTTLINKQVQPCRQTRPPPLRHFTTSTPCTTTCTMALKSPHFPHLVRSGRPVVLVLPVMLGIRAPGPMVACCAE